MSWTHIDKSHDPESIGHPGDIDTLSVQRIVGDVVQRYSMPGKAVAEVL